MPGPAQAGLFIYAKDLERVVRFYAELLGMVRLHTDPEICVLQSPDIQLVIHRIPPAYAANITITVPPTPREDTALKFFVTVPSLAQARTLAASLSGSVAEQYWNGPGFRACNALDPEGNILQLREPCPGG